MTFVGEGMNGFARAIDTIKEEIFNKYTAADKVTWYEDSAELMGFSWPNTRQHTSGAVVRASLATSVMCAFGRLRTAPIANGIT